MSKANDFDSARLYDRYEVTIKLRDRMYGGIPRNPELLRGHVERKTGFADEVTKEQVETLKAEMAANDPKRARKAEVEKEEIIDDKIEQSWNGFACDEKLGLFIHTRNLKACMRESWDLLGYSKKKMGSKQILQHGFEVRAPADQKGLKDRVYLGRAKPNGVDEKPLHVMTRQGPRDSLKRADYVENVTLRFEVWCFKTESSEKRHVTEDMIKEMLTLAQENGLGADRSQQQGKFDVQEFERIPDTVEDLLGK